MESFLVLTQLCLVAFGLYIPTIIAEDQRTPTEQSCFCTNKVVFV